MGLALLLVVVKSVALRTGGPHDNRCARFWTKSFAINFAMGVVTGIPMEFQFGTNWAKFSRAARGRSRPDTAHGGRVFLRSGVDVPRSAALWRKTAGALSPLGRRGTGFRRTTALRVLHHRPDAWMQNPVGYSVGPNGDIQLRSFAELIFTPWTLWQYLHNTTGAVVTAGVVIAAVGAFYLLAGNHEAYGRTFVRVGVTAGFIAILLMLFPTGDGQGKMMARHQPVTWAAMEGRFETSEGAPLALIVNRISTIRSSITLLSLRAP
jgi:cytochrome d ubiquinol oxidase subunit I